jgi:hypothetical protein
MVEAMEGKKLLLTSGRKVGGENCLNVTGLFTGE